MAMPFDGRLLAGVSVLAAVVEAGSFARAAETIGLSPSGVSRAIGRLEARIGVRLVHRTTRSVTLTDEGERFYAQVGPLLSGIEEAATTVTGDARAVRGRLRVNVHPLFSHLVLAPRIASFMSRYPDLDVELLARDELGDLSGEGIDVAVRFGESASSSLVARKLLETRVLTVATPDYIKQHGRPKTPQELLDHICIQFRDPLTRRPYEWEFRDGKKLVMVQTRGPLLVTDAETMLGACLAGAGIAQIFALSVHELLRKKQLVELFPDWPGETFPLYAFYPSRRHVPAKVRSFIDFCLEAVG
jgi:DNA-binding transcriptional LysR family regulator